MTNRPNGVERTYRAKKSTKSELAWLIAILSAPVIFLSAYILIVRPGDAPVASVIWLAFVLLDLAGIAAHVSKSRSTVTIDEQGIVVHRPGLRDFRARWLDLKPMVVLPETVSSKVTIQVGFGSTTSTTGRTYLMVNLQRHDGRGKCKIHDGLYEGGERPLHIIADYYARYFLSS